MTHLHIDFETRSTIDLTVAGLDNYAKHASTDIWCMGFAVDDEEPVLVTTETANSEQHILGGERGMYDVFNHIQDGGIVYAHNAAFELAIWNHICAPRYDWPVLKPEQCRCTMAMAYAMALPGALDNAAAAVGLDMQKDKTGHRLMLQMSKPRAINPDGSIVWWDEPDKINRLHEYCLQDVRTERELAARLMPLSDAEQDLWVIDQRINARGVQVDIEAVRGAIAVVQAEQDRLNARMRDVTGNVVGFCTEVARLGEWIRSRGVSMDSVAKPAVLDALTDQTLPDDVREALLLRQEAGKTSTAKLRAMIDAASSDGRLRGMFQYHGAGTGRWAGRRVQLQNLPRPKIGHNEIEDAIAVLEQVA